MEKDIIAQLTNENYKLLTENLIGVTDFYQAKKNKNPEFLKSQKISKSNFKSTIEMLSDKGLIDLTLFNLLKSNN